MIYKIRNLIIIPMVALTLVACSSISNNVPSLAATPTSGAKDAVLTDEENVMAFTECMRENGVEFMDPTVDSDGNIQKPEPVDATNLKREDVAEFYDVCGKFLEDMSYGGERVDRSETLDLYVELASCLREAGYDVEDPTVENFKTWMTNFKTIIDWDDPDALEAYETCNEETGGNAGNTGGGK